jgi:hypothetical protein
MLRATLVASLALLACGGTTPNPDGGTGGGAASTALDLNDVSFLYPLPALAQRALLPGLGAAGRGGPLLSRALFAALPPLMPDTPEAITYEELRVISARIDPCFPGSAPPAAPVCIPQLRLVAQPVQVDPLNPAELTTADATLHLFYTLSEADFGAALVKLRALKSLAQGLSGSYAAALNALLLEFCGPSTFTRVAFQAVNQQGNIWTFGAFNLEGGALVADLIPRLTNQKVQGVQQIGSVSSPSGGLIPAPANDDMDTLLSKRDVAIADTRTLERAVKQALIIEHPDKSSPLTIDCGSCHVASRALSAATAQRNLDTTGWAERFVPPAQRFNLSRVDGVGNDPFAQRAFGYLGRRSALSQRTINESAVVADALTRRP